MTHIADSPIPAPTAESWSFAEYVEYVAAALRLLRSGGLLILHDVLWYNTVANPGREGDETIIIREALDAVQAAESYTTTLLTVGNGLLVAVKN